MVSILANPRRPEPLRDAEEMKASELWHLEHGSYPYAEMYSPTSSQAPLNAGKPSELGF